MRTHLKESSHSIPRYQIQDSHPARHSQSQTCSIFNFFDEFYGKKEEQRRKNQENKTNEDKKGMVESWIREVEFEVIDENKPKCSGISLRTQFKQSNMMRSTMCNSHEPGTFDKNNRLRVKTLNKGANKQNTHHSKRFY